MASRFPTSRGRGDLLDHYKLEDLAGVGGTASVFRATDMTSGRVVAIKIPLSDTLNDRAALESFQLESEVARKFDHPGLVKVLSSDSGTHRYTVMEWVEGRLLREILDEQGTLSPERSIRITLAICGALEHIHSHGLVHHDLKPDNVIVGAGDAVKLIDFGAAREKPLSLWKWSRPKSAMGTPDYVSPEQIRGKRADGRSDVYSLGVMLYEMLTGEVPFSGLAPAEAMNLRLLVDPPCPGEINPGISLRLRNIIQRALARDPAKRYAGAHHLASDLSEQLADEAAARRTESIAGV